MHSLYQQKIMDHYHFPQHKGSVQGPSCLQTELANPSCGDQVTIAVALHNGLVQKAKFSGVGCILSLATADILMGHIIGKTIESLRDITPETMQHLVGIPVGPTRSKCLLLSLHAVHQLVKLYDPAETTRA